MYCYTTKMWFYPFGNDRKLKEQAKTAVKNRCNWLQLNMYRLSKKARKQRQKVKERN